MPIEIEHREASPVQRNRGRPRDDEARRRILAAALEVLGEFGFANTTAEAIAERAKTGKATIYRWWPDKTAVVIEALREVVAREVPLSDTGDLYEDIRLQLQYFLRLLTGERGPMFRAFLVAAQHAPQLAEAFHTIWRDPFDRISKRSLHRHRHIPLRDNLDLDIVLDVMYGPIYYRVLRGEEVIGLEYTDALADIVLRGITNK